MPPWSRPKTSTLPMPDVGVGGHADVVRHDHPRLADADVDLQRDVALAAGRCHADRPPARRCRARSALSGPPTTRAGTRAGRCRRRGRCPRPPRCPPTARASPPAAPASAPASGRRPPAIAAPAATTTPATSQSGPGGGAEAGHEEARRSRGGGPRSRAQHAGRCRRRSPLGPSPETSHHTSTPAATRTARGNENPRNERPPPRRKGQATTSAPRRAAITSARLRPARPAVSASA